MLKRFGSESPPILEAADTVSVFISHLKIESLISLLYSDSSHDLSARSAGSNQMMNHAHLDYIPLKVNSNMVQHPGEEGPSQLTHKLQMHLRKIQIFLKLICNNVHVSFLSGFTSLYATVGQ